ncbi:histidine kinase [Geobacter sulfurreducens]|nr:histidine kinase [Geobacter sulfurreducens]
MDNALTLQPLERIVTEHEGWLAARALGYAKSCGYTRYTSTLEEAWRISIAGLSASLIHALRAKEPIPELSPDYDSVADPVTLFGIEEARRHRMRGVTLGMFLGLMKYYRRSYQDLVRGSGVDEKTLESGRLFIDRFFDRVEIGFTTEWSSVSDPQRLAELEEANRSITNEKNRLLTLFESIPSPVMLLGADGRPVLMNHAAVELFAGPTPPGTHYYRESGSPGLEVAVPRWSRLKRFLKGKAREARFEESIDTAAGCRYFLVTVQRMLDVSEKFCGTTIILSDFTGRKLAEDELQHLVAEMEDRIRSRTAELLDANTRLLEEIEERRRSERFFHATIDSLTAPVAILNGEGDIVTVNRAWRKFADENGGLHPNHFIGYNYLGLCDNVKGDDAVTASAVARGIRELIAGRINEFHVDYPCHSPDEQRWFQVRVTRLENGSRGRVAVVHENISEVKKAQEEILSLNRSLEERIRHRTQQLECSNRELEGFCYAVSHDLRSHLARLEGLGRGLLEDCFAGLDNQARHYAERICRISMDLRRAIDSLLDLSRLARCELSNVTVDLSGVAERVAEELHQLQPLRRVSFSLEPGVIVRGDPQLLETVMRHLMGNAWKFTSRREDAEIAFGSTMLHGMKTCFVRDNGVGFDMRYAATLFQPFQRLHGPAEFDGAGIGLATVQRIIQRHGGRIWAEGESGKGAVFFFVFPD